MEELLKEQLSEYLAKLKIVEAKIVEKYKNGEDYSKELEEASGLKFLIDETLRMLKAYCVPLFRDKKN